MTGQAATFAAVLVGLLVAHQVGDHWVQTARQADTKGQPGDVGLLACAVHVATYTLTTTAITGMLWVALDLRISATGFVAGQSVSAFTHYLADRRWPLHQLCAALGKSDFYRFDVPREGRDDNPTLGTGAYALDQSWHWFWLFVAALVTTLI